MHARGKSETRMRLSFPKTSAVFGKVFLGLFVRAFVGESALLRRGRMDVLVEAVRKKCSDGGCDEALCICV